MANETGGHWYDAWREYLQDFFGLERYDTSIRTEAVAGLTTFLTMSYIIVVNPIVLGEAITIPGYSDGEVIQMLTVVTILAAFVGCLVMGVYANRPFGLAPGMGSNAFFASTVVLGLGIPWQTALSAVFVEGLVFILITALGIRKYLVKMIPEPVKKAVGAGIGGYLLFLGLSEMNIIVASDSGVSLGNIPSSATAILSLVGILITLGLWVRGIKGGIVLGVIITAAFAWILTFTNVVAPGVLVPESLPEVNYNIAPLAGAFISGFEKIKILDFALVFFVFFMLDFFVTAGTLIGVGQVAGFLDEDGNLPEIEKPLMSDAIATTVGAILGTSTVGTYVESSTGVEAGGRTGLTALFISVLFVLSLLIVPLVTALPTYAVYIGLIVVGLIMLQGLEDVDWNNPVWAVSGGLTVLMMPLSSSLSNGLAAGIISYPIVKVANGEWNDIRIGQWVLAIAFVVYYYLRMSGL